MDILTSRGDSDRVGAHNGLEIAEISHFFGNIELGVVSKFIEGVGHQKTICAVNLLRPRRRPVPIKSIQFAVGLSDCSERHCIEAQRPEPNTPQAFRWEPRQWLRGTLERVQTYSELILLREDTVWRTPNVVNLGGGGKISVVNYYRGFLIPSGFCTESVEIR